MKNNYNNNLFRSNSLFFKNENFKKEALIKTKKIFEFYCSFGDRLNFKYLKSFKYLKLLEDSNILKNKNVNAYNSSPLSRIDLEIIYKSINKSNTMNFEEFLKSLMKISMEKYHFSKDKKRNTLQLIIENILPLYDKIFEYNKDNLNDIKNIEIYLKKDNIIRDLQRNAEVWYDIYRNYFKNEVSLISNFELLKNESSKNYNEFVKDFDIAPGLISKSAAYNIYLSETTDEEVDKTIQENKDFYLYLIKNINFELLINFEGKKIKLLGVYFSFFKFLRCLVKLADISFYPLNINTKETLRYNKQISNIEGKFNLFLEKLEQSKGFLEIPIKNSKNHTYSNSILSYNLYSTLNKEKNNNNYSLNDEIYNSSCLLKNFSYNNINNSTGELCSSNIEKVDSKNNYNNSNYNNENFDKEKIIVGRSFNPENIRDIDLIIYHNNYFDLCEYTDYIMQKYGKDLKKIFIGICQFGDISNRTLMKNKSFYQMLNDAKLIKNKENENYYQQIILDNNENYIPPFYLLKVIELDDIFIKLSNLPIIKNSTNYKVKNNIFGKKNYFSYNNIFTNNEFNKSTINSYYNIKNLFNFKRSFSDYKKKKINYTYIDFNSFIIGIEILSKIIYNNLKARESIDYLIQQNLFKFLGKYVEKHNIFKGKIEKICIFEEKYKDLEIFTIIKDIVFPLYLSYTKNKKFMNFEQFLNFNKEFEIFPHLFSYTYLNESFYCMSNMINENDNKDKIVINFDKFFLLLCLISFDININEKMTTNEKMLFFIDKLIIIKDKWKIREKLKHYFPERYKVQKKKEENVFEIFYI